MAGLKDKYKKTFRLGQVIEEKFRYVIENDIGGVHSFRRATEEEDINTRTDFVVDGNRVDVKGVRYIKRCDRRRSARSLIIEITNINGKKVFDKDFTHYAFEIDEVSPAFVLVRKGAVKKFLADLYRDIMNKCGEVLFVDRRKEEFRRSLPKMFALYRRPTDYSICFVIPHNYALNKLIREYGGVIVRAESMPFHLINMRLAAEEEIKFGCRKKGWVNPDEGEYWWRYKPDDYDEFSVELI